MLDKPTSGPSTLNDNFDPDLLFFIFFFFLFIFTASYNTVQGVYRLCIHKSFPLTSRQKALASENFINTLNSIKAYFNAHNYYTNRIEKTNYGWYAHRSFSRPNTAVPKSVVNLNIGSA